MATTAVVKRAPKPDQIILQNAAKLAPLLPPDLTLDALARIVAMEAERTPQLRLCTTSSLIRAISNGLRSGLPIGELWYLMPFKSRDLSAKYETDVYECTGSADYKGIAHLMIASGAVRAVEMHCVYEGDHFHYQYGLDARLEHQPVHRKARGRMLGAYVVLRLPFGQSTFLYMPVEDIEDVRQHYSRSWKKGDLPAWYAKKTVIRQISKLWPKDPKLMAARRAIEADEREEIESRMALPVGVIDDEGVVTPVMQQTADADDGEETDAERAARLREDQELAAQEDGELPLADTRKPKGRPAQLEGR